jgi:iron complex transport system substrate-binding protein
MIRRSTAMAPTLVGLILAVGLVPAPGARAVNEPAAGISVRDDIGRDVTFDHYPQRIVSLLPSLTETVCELGACDRLVATDRFSDWPARVRTLPKTGGLEDAQIEEIVRLHPDLVLLSRSQRITDRLHELGVESFALDTQTYASIAHIVATVGEILGVPGRSSAVNQEIERAVHEIGAQAIAKRHGAGPTAYIEVDGAPYAAGPESFIGEMLLRLGARNIVTPDLGPFPKLNPEYVVRRDPDVIFLLHSDVLHLADRPGWDQIRAVKENHLCSFPADVLFTIIRPGPRVAEGMRAMEQCLERVSP